MTTPDNGVRPSESVEAPEEDSYEQAVPTEPAEPDEEIHRGLEVNEYDALEQAHTVPEDDEYR